VPEDKSLTAISGLVISSYSFGTAEGKTFMKSRGFSQKKMDIKFICL